MEKIPSRRAAYTYQDLPEIVELSGNAMCTAAHITDPDFSSCTGSRIWLRDHRSTGAPTYLPVPAGAGNVDDDEMYRTFNMAWALLCSAEEEAQDTCRIMGPGSKVIGSIVKRSEGRPPDL